MQDQKIYLEEQHHKFYANEFCHLRSETEEKFSKSDKRHKIHGDQLESHKKLIDDLNHFSNFAKKQFGDIDKKINRESTSLKECINNLQNDLETKIETVEKVSSDSFNDLMTITSKNLKETNQKIERTVIEFEK